LTQPYILLRIGPTTHGGDNSENLLPSPHYFGSRTKLGAQILFTPFMRSHALKTKPQKISNDHYAVIWDGADVEYSFEFEYAAPRGFRLTSYLIGPR
jgi:hypothetical protein